ncbi:MAG: hypothetical protein IKF37_03565 [Bacilli bacterium]|nr:hypothetical protein [Bacilli bacterium]
MKDTSYEKRENWKKAIIKKKYVSIFLALFTLGVNIFAWFAFSANASLSLDATVAAWDIEFKEDDVETHDVEINIAKMKPGMSDYAKTVMVYNHSDVVADFSFEVTSFTLLGNTISVNDPATYLKTNYPFKVNFTPSANYIGINQYISFDTIVHWGFEETDKYYTMDSVYTYDPGFVYYINNGEEYVEFEVSDSTVFDNNKNRLYIEKDDADSFFGMQCALYEKDTGKSCLSLTLRLLAQQRLGS